MVDPSIGKEMTCGTNLLSYFLVQGACMVRQGNGGLLPKHKEFQSALQEIHAEYSIV